MINELTSLLQNFGCNSNLRWAITILSVFERYFDLITSETLPSSSEGHIDYAEIFQLEAHQEYLQHYHMDIEIIREEFAHASDEFHLVRKDQDTEKKKSQLSADILFTFDDMYSDDNSEYMSELGLVVDMTSVEKER
ncbi:hypothetical protein Glove_109g255 [Diversispora epigaea]|uniref:Uncharacterized protein n=1 Tax=Diversispora epigaea TaxID=1348612 RepID=A0A397JBD9_9GLOM|nr:hypothetical protein Glove_109g255 [Diversispora epigaea]